MLGIEVTIEPRLLDDLLAAGSVMNVGRRQRSALSLNFVFLVGEIN